MVVDDDELSLFLSLLILLAAVIDLWKYLFFMKYAVANPPESIEIADIATIETAELIVESCGVHDIDGWNWNEESLIFLYFQFMLQHTSL